ncbi:hypothetical protein PLICRDRAFT_91952 [Plicaturopsis crispa FD-325 SS-3]|nr:hypothetical protein PLICRDRAFT_91952 [Plicaturopsis crispa FD-325 SS-3]
MLATARNNLRREVSANLHRKIARRATPVRNISNEAVHPSIRGFARSLNKKQPCFSMASRDVDILSRPDEFYRRLLDMIRRARKRIFISSLYIGSKEHELVDALQISLASNPTLHVHLLLDLNRSTRPGASSTSHLLSPLLRIYPTRVHVSLFRSPKLSGIMAKLVPPRLNEGWGTWHAKVYGVDDEVMISGANLNESYFTNRQDRYIHLTQPALAEYCFQFMQTISAFSYHLLAPTPSSPEYNLSWPDSQTNPHKFQRKAEKALTDFQASTRLSLLSEEQGSHDTVIFPIIQAGQFNVREEEECLTLLFKHLAENAPSSSTPGPLVDLTSGYFGLSKSYQSLIIDSTVDCRIVAASPKANGFFGSGGLSGHIPGGYTILEQQFMEAVGAAGRTMSIINGRPCGVELNEWERDGWTYHAKGIWLSPTPDAAPTLTLFGSTNLNTRSAQLDTELSFVMMTMSPALRQQLREEVHGLRANALPWQGATRKIPWRTKALARLAEGML